MSGTPTETELQTQWKAVVDMLETARAHADDTQAGASGKFDTLVQSLEGEYTPAALTSVVDRVRALLSSIVEPSSALEALSPIVFEYSNILSADASGGYGGGTDDIGKLVVALREWFHDNSMTVQSRAITYDTTATAGGSNTGDGTVSRLTEDANGYNLEACHVEKKQLRCVQDANSGAQLNAEVFELQGEATSRDALLRGSYGSGEQKQLRNQHSGSGAGGSLLANSSFSTYDASATPRFAGWTTDKNAQLAQDTTNTYQSHPGAQTDAALRINSGDGTVTLTQARTAMRQRQFDPNSPYFFRIMVNKTVGTAVGGSVTIRLGSTTATSTITALGSGWVELAIAFDQTAWFASFNEEDLDVQIEWSGPTSGYLLIDCAILAKWELADGTYWMIRGAASSPTPWLKDDILTFTDTGGAPGTGKLQYWMWAAGLGYLPSAGSPTVTDP